MYIDALVLRDRDTTIDGDYDAPSERLWAIQDANFNVTALVDGSGNVVERYAYDPYGVPTVYDASWNVRGGSSYHWKYRHQGLRYDDVVGLESVRDRDTRPWIQRALQNDRIGIRGGDPNFYRWLGNNPTGRLDPLGMSWFSDAFDAVNLPGAVWSWIVAPSESAMNRPIVRPNPDSLRAGDRIPAESWYWYDNSVASAPKILAGSGLMIGTLLLPTPDDIFIAFALKKGLQAVQKGGTRVLMKDGRELTEQEAKALWDSYLQRPAPRGRGRFGSVEARDSHAVDHRKDFGCASPTAYEKQAADFLTGPQKSGVLQKTRPDGYIVRYDPATNEFGVIAPNGTLLTYFKPDKAIHDYTSNLEYFNAQ